MSESWRNVAKDDIRFQMCRVSIKKKEYEIFERGFRDKLLLNPSREEEIVV